MRTIVAFLFAAFSGAATLLAQNSASERMATQEKNIAAHPDDPVSRQVLLRQLVNPGIDLAPDQVREIRRRHILWVIAHHPDWPLLEEPSAQLLPRGRLADPEGQAQAEQLWKQITSKPDASTKAIAHYALFYIVMDRSAGFAILDAATKEHPDDAALGRARGILDEAAFLGISGAGDTGQFSTSATLRTSPQAKAALEEIQTSKNAAVLEGAGEFIMPPNKISIRFDPFDLSSDDPYVLGQQWLRRAVELASPKQAEEWKPALGAAVRFSANRTTDPREKVRLLKEAYDLVADNTKMGVLADLTAAEFDAGDDAAAGRDARKLLEAPKDARAYNVGQTILGRLALAHGDQNEAKERLLASVKLPDSMKNSQVQPDMNLAQDLFEAGARDTVVEFLQASRTVWKFDRGRLDHMINFAKKAPTVDLVQMANRFPGNEIAGRPAPPFEAKDQDGKTWTRDQTSGKVVGIAFGDGPSLDKLSKDFSARGAILLKASASKDDPVARRFEIESNPTLVVIDAKGNVTNYHAGTATEAEWRSDLETGFNRLNTPFNVPLTPVQIGPKNGTTASGKITLSWEPSDNAESYLVEWDHRDEKGWVFDRESTVRVIPTRETSTTLDVTGFSQVRWRVLGVGRFGPGSKPSPWWEIDAGAVTKNYNRP